jgi:DNA-binding beta-propeller fold protein YncE
MLTAALLTVLFETAMALTLPGGPPVGMDYLAYDPGSGLVWVPAGNTGRVDVVDTMTGKLTQLTGFATRPAPRPGRPNLGPSSVTVGEGEVWIGNRADNSLCAFGSLRLDKRRCIQLASMPDGLAYVAATHELWVTTPRDHSITVVGLQSGTHPSTPRPPEIIAMAGSPEGYAVDNAENRFYTNLEDHDVTVTIDVRTRKPLATWPAGCGAAGPRGLAIDAARRLLFVACTDGAEVRDLAHGGKQVGRLATGGGVDNIDYHAGKGLLYVASAQDATLTIARVGRTGELTSTVVVPTAKGARNPVVDARGTAYVADSQGGALLVITLPAASATSPP